MTTVTSLSAERRYMITDAGHKAVFELETCRCQWMIWDQALLVCPECMTAYRVSRPAGRVNGTKKS